MKAHIISLGCPKNLCDTEVIMGELVCAGYSITQNLKDADIIVINTCAFLRSARDESFAIIKKAIKNKKHKAKIYVAGCLPKIKNEKNRLNKLSKLNGIINSDDIFDSHSPRIKATNPWTAYIKISEGCNNRCSYCLIPKIRGPLKNRKVADILKETRELSKKGEKEGEFLKLADFIKKMQFERLGIFKYSKEEGTSAAKLRGQIPEKVKEFRFHKLMALQNQISKGLNKKLIGKTFEVLIEKIGKNFCIGRTYMDAPDIDGSVKIFNPNLKLGRFVKAKIVKASAYDLEAVLT